MRTPADEARALFRRPLVWIVSLALAVRVILLLCLHDSYYASGMAQGELARNIAMGRGFVVNIPFSDSLARLQAQEQRLIDIEEALQRIKPQDQPGDFRPFIAYMMPGQGMLLAAANVISGRYRYIDLQVLQAIADALSVVMISVIGTILFGRRVGLLAALLCALYLPTARLAISATRDAWMPLIYIGVAFFFIKGWKERRVVDFLLAGVVVACGSYFRSEILLLPVFLALGLLVLEWKRRRLALLAVVGFIPVVLLLLPWSVRNAIVFDRVIPTNSGLWMAMWQSFGEYDNDFGASNSDMVTLQQMRAQGHPEAYDTPEYDDLFRDKVVQVLRSRPGWVIWTMVRRIARIPLQMHSWGIPQTDEMTVPGTSYAEAGKVDLGAYWHYVTSDPLLFLVQMAARGVNVLLYLAVLLAMVWQRGRFAKPGLVLLLIPLYNILVHAVIGVHARYIVPTNPLLLMFVALLVASFFGKQDQQSSPDHSIA
jgi:4-amino-4-deoxy-L-arabinose transferase-like glycosyltransferase